MKYIQPLAHALSMIAIFFGVVMFTVFSVVIFGQTPVAHASSIPASSYQESIAMLDDIRCCVHVSEGGSHSSGSREEGGSPEENNVPHSTGSRYVYHPSYNSNTSSSGSSGGWNFFIGIVVVLVIMFAWNIYTKRRSGSD